MRVMLRLMIIRFLLLAFCFTFTHLALGGGLTPENAYEVSWDASGKNFKDSMPIGNGDLGMMVPQ